MFGAGPISGEIQSTTEAATLDVSLTRPPVVYRLGSADEGVGVIDAVVVSESFGAGSYEVRARGRLSAQEAQFVRARIDSSGPPAPFTVDSDRCFIHRGLARSVGISRLQIGSCPRLCTVSRAHSTLIVIFIYSYWK